MKKNLIISSGIVFIMLILSTLTLFTRTIKTPAFIIGYIFLDIAIVLQIIPWGVLKFKNNLEFLRVPYIIVYGVYLIIQFILFKMVIRMTPMLTMSVVLLCLMGIAQLILYGAFGSIEKNQTSGEYSFYTESQRHINLILVSVNDDSLKTELKKAVDNIKYGNRKSSVNSMELEDKIEGTIEEIGRYVESNEVVEAKKLVSKLNLFIEKIMNFDISAMKLRAKSLVKQCGNTPALIEALLWLLRVIAVMCGSLSTQNGSIGGYIISGVATLLLIFLPVGSEWYTLNVAREETPDFQSVFDGITKMPIKVLLITIIRSIMCYVFAIFLIVPIIFPIYWFRPVFYIAKDKQGMSFIKVMAESIKLMKGNKMAWFKLDLSFIGWYILNTVTLGFAGFYSLPIMKTTYAEFYDFIKGKNEMF